MVYQLPLLAGCSGLSHGFSTKKAGNQKYGGLPKHQLILNNVGFLRHICPEDAGYPLGVSVRMLPLRPGFEEEIVIISSADAGRGMASEGAIPCEGMVTDSPNLFLFITVGDCIPTILFDQRRSVLALVHGGRESTIRRIPEKTLRVMREKFHTDPADVIVGMGPGFRSHFLERLPTSIGNDALWDVHIRPNGHKTFFMDLFGYNNDRLVASGVPEENIEECPYDTYTEADMYFSHRRSLETKETDGRHACAVGMVE